MARYEIITSTHNPLVKMVMELKKSRSAREKEKLTLVEGKNLLKDLLQRHPAPFLFVTEENLSDSLPCQKLFLVSKEVMEKMTTVETPEGMIALFPICSHSIDSIESPLLILDGLQDPGNIGTMLRTASSFGLRHVVSILPSADLWQPKVMRAAKGMHYYFDTLLSTTWETLLPYLEKKHISPVIGTLHKTPLDSFEVPERWALVLGSESHGPTFPKGHEAAYFTIPMQSHVDSLNAAQAGAIALYVFSRSCKAALQ